MQLECLSGKLADVELHPPAFEVFPVGKDNNDSLPVRQVHRAENLKVLTASFMLHSTPYSLPLTC